MHKIKFTNQNLLLCWSIMVLISCRSELEELPTMDPTEYTESIEKMNTYVFTVKNKLSNKLLFDFQNAHIDNTLLVADINSREFFQFNYSSGQLLDTFSLPAEGPNALEDLDSWSSIHKIGDSLVINDYVKHELIIFNDFQIVEKNKIYIDQKNVPYGRGPIKLSPFQNGFLMPVYNFSTRISQMPSTVYIENGKFSGEYFHYPEIYEKNYYSVYPWWYMSSMVWNPDRNMFVVSFPVDPYVYTYDRDFNVTGKYWAGSQYFEEVKPVAYGRKALENYKTYTYDEKILFTISNFAFLYYDTINKRYYRTTFLKPESIEDVGNTEYPYNMSVIILDEDFNKTGEFYFEERYDYPHIYLVGDELLLWKDPSYLNTVEDSILQFDAYKLLKLQ